MRKHDHKKTTDLKVTIFKIMMLMPFILFFSLILITAFSENISFINQNTNGYDSIIIPITDNLYDYFFYWTGQETNEIYNIMTNLTNEIGITESNIPNLLTYWATITIIYIIFDIIIQAFVAVTHIFTGSKNNA